jgi:hypothetical protein
MMANFLFQRSWVHSRLAHYIGTEEVHEEEGKLALERLQTALPVRAKTRRKTITPDKAALSEQPNSEPNGNFPFKYIERNIKYMINGSV